MCCVMKSPAHICVNFAYFFDSTQGPAGYKFAPHWSSRQRFLPPCSWLPCRCTVFPSPAPGTRFHPPTSIPPSTLPRCHPSFPPASSLSVFSSFHLAPFLPHLGKHIACCTVQHSTLPFCAYSCTCCLIYNLALMIHIACRFVLKRFSVHHLIITILAPRSKLKPKKTVFPGNFRYQNVDQLCIRILDHLLYGTMNFWPGDQMGSVVVRIAEAL